MWHRGRRSHRRIPAYRRGPQRGESAISGRQIYEQVKPYLPLGEALGKLLAQLAPANADRIYITYGGHAQKLPNTDADHPRGVARVFSPAATSRT